MGPPARPKASDVIAELWREREEAARRPVPPPPPPLPPATVPTLETGSGRGRPFPALVAAIVAAALLLGVGAGVIVATRSSGPSLQKFVARADAVCGRGNGAITAIVKPTSYPDLAAAGAAVATTTKAQVDELRRLEAPGGSHGKDVRNLLTAMDGTSQAAASLADAAGKKDDGTTIAATKELKTQFDATSTEAKVLGFSACATGMTSGMTEVLGGSQSVLKTAFVAKADALCRAGARELDGVADPRSETPRELARYLDDGLSIVTKLMTDLRALPVPPGDEGAVADMLTAQDKADAKIREMRDAASRADESTFAAASHELDPLVTAADAKFDAYGLGICGSNFGEE